LIQRNHIRNFAPDISAQNQNTFSGNPRELGGFAGKV